MTKLMCVVLGLAMLAMGILGITGWVPMFRTNPVYVNIIEIILGGLGITVGIYARQNVGNNSQATVLSKQEIDIEQQRINIDQQRKDIDQQRKDIDQQRTELNQQQGKTLNIK